jgi:transcriptional regulator with XRE-family HTH domain
MLAKLLVRIAVKSPIQYRIDYQSSFDKLFVMPKSPQALSTMPPAAVKALEALGENLAIARTRRRESQRAWAKRLGVSIPTLIRMERGDPGVGVGIYVTALWLIGRSSALADLAAPASDRGALESDVRAAMTRRAVRSAASAQARLARKPLKRG